MASVLADIGTLAADAAFRVRIKAALADKAQATLVDAASTPVQITWAKTTLRNLDGQVDRFAWYVAAIGPVTGATTDLAIKNHVSNAVAVLAAV